MSDDKLSELWKTQKSLTEWFEDIKHADAAAHRHEDNEKRERLKVLNDVISLPFDKPTQFEASDLANNNKNFAQYLKENGKELCALRLIPQIEGLPKLRMRGKTVEAAYDWFKEQDLDPAKYRADFIPHAADDAWATIFVINKHGIMGEIIYGGHHQLTQGFHEGDPPTIFKYDFKTWDLQPANPDALKHLKKLAKFLRVSDATKRKQLHKLLRAKFTHNYLEGYFETTDSSLGTWFIDYNRLLGRTLADLDIKPPSSSSDITVRGHIGNKGSAEGQVCLVGPGVDPAEFSDGDVLVCVMTTPNHVGLMQKACAIVTDQGGILSHAAIVARELGKPCIVGTGNATTSFKNGQLVLVDADKGVVLKKD